MLDKRTLDIKIETFLRRKSFIYPELALREDPPSLSRHQLRLLSLRKTKTPLGKALS